MSESSEELDERGDELDEDDEAEEEGDEAESSEGAGAGKGPRRGRNKPQSAEPRDEREQKVHDFLTTLVEQMEMDCSVVLGPPREDAPDDITLEIEGPDSGRIIGKKGQVLSALQFLCNRIVNRPGLDRRYVSVDAEGYRSRRDDSLATMARRLGKQAVTDGKIITFEPMSPRDRRVVHLALAKIEGVVTKSEGEGEDRRVQIIPVRR
jgi:spoIIIJ-associated protein